MDTGCRVPRSLFLKVESALLLNLAGTHPRAKASIVIAYIGVSPSSIASIKLSFGLMHVRTRENRRRHNKNDLLKI